MNIINRKGIEFLQFKSFPKENLFHFTTTIKGGVSEDNYATFNLGRYSGDDIEHITENRQRLADMLNIDEENIYVPYQTHGDKILIIDEKLLSQTDLEKSKLLNGIDALITDQKNICIGITTADCVPVLLFDPIKNILAAIHAGWKGTVQYIAAKTAYRMVNDFHCKPEDIVAGIAPSISPEYFEVGDEVFDAFAQAGFDMDEISFRNADTGKYHIDLWEANRVQLVESGILINNIKLSNLCTYRESELFFSARRQTIHSGRMITGGILR